MNTKLTHKVLNHVQADTGRLDQTGWGYHIHQPDPPFAVCGTRACIAGWALILSGEFILSSFGDFTSLDGGQVAVGTEARRLLQISLDDARSLFCTYDPDDAIELFTRLIEAAEAEQVANPA